MKFSCSVEINQPIEKVVELFNNPNNLKHWQNGLQSFEHLEGEPGMVGAKSKMIFNNGGKTFDLFEEITVSNLPTEFSGIYDHESMRNSMKNYFKPIDSSTTLWNAELEYEFKTTTWRILGKLMKPMFSKQTQKFLDNFKMFAETGKGITN